MGSYLNRYFIELLNSEDYHMARILLENKGNYIDKKLTDSDGNTALIIATINNDYNFIWLLLHEFGYTGIVDKVNNYENTALHWAVINNSIDIIKELLLIPTINISIENFEGNTPLMIANKKGFNEAEDILKKATSFRDLYK